MARVTGHNTETGEVHEFDLTLPAKSMRERYDRPWVATFDAALEVLMDAALTITDYRVLMAVVASSPLTGEPWLTRPGRIAERLGIGQNRVSTSLKKLVEIGLLERPERGMVAFGPSYFWRGTAQARAAAMRAKAYAQAAADDAEIADAIARRKEQS